MLPSGGTEEGERYRERAASPYKGYRATGTQTSMAKTSEARRLPSGWASGEEAVLFSPAGPVMSGRPASMSNNCPLRPSLQQDPGQK